MSERYSEFRWRSLVTLIGVGFVLVFLRLGWVQVVRGDAWQERAAIFSTDTEDVLGRRGRLLDRNGEVLARSEVYTRVGVARPQEWLHSQYVGRVAAMLGLSESEVRRRLRGRRVHTILVEDALLDAPTRQRLATLPNMSLDHRTRRIRPHDGLARQLLGNVSSAGEGATGLERLYDNVLAGRPGRFQLRQDANEALRSRIPLEKAIDGGDVITTLDLRVQSILEREIEIARVDAGAWGAQGIVLEVGTGEVVAMAQAPFNAPAPNGDKQVDPWRVMGATDDFEPGSVFKLFTLATLLSKSVLDTSTVFDGGKKPGDRRTVKVFPGGRKIRDVHPVGRVSIRHAFVTSSNIIFATAAGERLRREEFAGHLRKFGVVERPGTGLARESDGQLLPVKDWSGYMVPSLAIGQGVAVTLLQLASSSAALLGDGCLRTPLLVRGLVGPDGERRSLKAVARRRNVVPQDVRDILRSVTRGVVEEDYGTGKTARVPGLSIGGKTSTAQISNSDGYLRGVYTPIFLGAVPAEDPRLIVIIVLHGAPGERTYGGNTAAPCFANVVREIGSRTDWLEDAFEVQPVQVARTIEAPALVGRTAAEVRELCEASPWTVDCEGLPENLRAIGQLPVAGTPMPEGSVVQLAWSGALR